MLVAMTAGFASAEGFGEDSISKGAHYPARNCEIFMDKISAQFGSHAYRGLNIWVKTLNSRLDSDIVQVGFRYKLVGNGYSGGSAVIDNGWKELVLDQFMGSKDYYKLSLNISSDFYQGAYTGVFYVRTANGTNYWLKTSNGGDFVFDVNGYNNVSNAMGMTNYSSDINVAVPTQRPDMYYYNPGMCR